VGKIVIDNAVFRFICSGDIRDQSVQLSKIAPNFGQFLLSQIPGKGAGLPKIVHRLSCLPCCTSRGKVGTARLKFSHFGAKWNNLTKLVHMMCSGETGEMKFGNSLKQEIVHTY